MIDQCIVLYVEQETKASLTSWILHELPLKIN